MAKKGPEKKVKDEIKEWLEDMGAWVLPYVTTGYGRSGIPDFLVCYRGLFIAIEVKAPGKEDTLTAWQEKELNAIVEAGGRAYLISDVIVLKKIIYALFPPA
jgi:Holliday junction resolvase